MNQHEFSRLRKKIGKTQKTLAQLLGTSIKAVHSYEQGWRRIPPHAERQMIFLALRADKPFHRPENCWDVRCCPLEKRRQCPAWEFNAGDMCWFINGTICAGEPLPRWQDKMALCRSCIVLEALFKGNH